MKPDFELREGVIYPLSLRALDFLKQFYIPDHLKAPGIGAVKAYDGLLRDIKESALVLKKVKHA